MYLIRDPLFDLVFFYPLSFPPGENEGREKTKLLNQVVCEHFFRQGMLDITDSLISVRSFQSL